MIESRHEWLNDDDDKAEKKTNASGLTWPFAPVWCPGTQSSGYNIRDIKCYPQCNIFLHYYFVSYLLLILVRYFPMSVPVRHSNIECQCSIAISFVHSFVSYIFLFLFILFSKSSSEQNENTKNVLRKTPSSPPAASPHTNLMDNGWRQVW